MSTRRAFLFAAGVAAAAERPRLTLTDTAGEKVTVLYNGALLLEHRYAAARPKTYIHPLCLPGGEPLTIDSPHDHVHHRGLMVAWSEIDGIDFWGETNPGRHGQIVHERFEKLRAKPPLEIVERNRWVGEGKLLLMERRTIRIPVPVGGGTWVDWTTELEAVNGPVRLAAGQHVYDGLGVRVAPAMDGGGVLNSNGTNTIAKANGEKALWCAYHGAGKTIAFFDHPSNPRHPNPFFVMNDKFGYMSAAPTFYAPFELAAKQKIRFRWGVLAFAGEPQAAALDARFRAWG